MPRSIVLLRAVNVGGKSALSMKALATALGDAGYADVRTLIASGNVILGAKASGAALETKIENDLAVALGLNTSVMARSPAEWRAIVDANPLTEEATRAPAKLVLLVLKSAPTKAAIAAYEAGRKKRDTPETVVIRGREAYAFYPDGIGRSKLDLSALGAGTARNWNTMIKLRDAVGSAK